MTAVKFRPMKFGVTRVKMREGQNGVRYMMADQALSPYAERMTDRLCIGPKKSQSKLYLRVASRMQMALLATGNTSASLMRWMRPDTLHRA